MIMEEFGISAVENLMKTTGWKMMGVASETGFFLAYFHGVSCGRFREGNQKKTLTPVESVCLGPVVSKNMHLLCFVRFHALALVCSH